MRRDDAIKAHFVHAVVPLEEPGMTSNADGNDDRGTARGRASRREALAFLGFVAAAGLVHPAAAQYLPSRVRLAPFGGRVHREAPSDDTVDVLHGVRVPDPFRPLEDLTRADVRDWIAAEDAAARGVLLDDPLHARVRTFLQASLRYRRSAGQRRLGRELVSLVHDGLKERSWLEIGPISGDGGRTLIDPNEIAPKGHLALGNYVPDRSQGRITYLTTENGGDEQTIRIRDVASGQDLPDVITGCRFTSIVWLPDGQSFYYTRPPRPEEDTLTHRTSLHVYHHVLGTPASNDRLVWRAEGHRGISLSLRSINGSRQLLVSGRIGTDDAHGIWVGPVEDPSRLRGVVAIGTAAFTPVHAVGGLLYALTDLGAPRGRIVRVLLADGSPEGWHTVVPEGNGVIDGAVMIGKRLIVRRFERLGHRLEIHDVDSGKVADVDIPGTVRIRIDRTERTASDMRVNVDDRRRPVRQMRLNIRTGSVIEIAGPKPPHTLEDAVIRQTEAVSEDGTHIPVTLMYLPGLAMNGTNRTLLYGYGSYGITQQPGYSSLAAAWVRLGGVYAVAAVRGGAEFGRTWHDGARQASKRNAVSDIVAAAEHLIASGMTSTPHLGCFGASSGGRLMLGAMVRRPDLFGAVAVGVPLVDMLRFHKHTFGASWKTEYGDPDRAADFAWLHALSPLHNIRAGATYPPLLLLTGDNDQRVVPSHAYKFAATLRRASPGSVVLVRTRRDAGHGPGNATSKVIDYQSDIVTFLMSRLGGPVRELPQL